MPVAIERMKHAVLDARTQAEPHPVTRLVSLKRPFQFHVRNFDEATEAAKVERYTSVYAKASAMRINEIFATMRKELAPQQGQVRNTTLQAMLIGMWLSSVYPQSISPHSGWRSKAAHHSGTPMSRNWRTTGSAISRRAKDTPWAGTRRGPACIAMRSRALANESPTRPSPCCRNWLGLARKRPARNKPRDPE